jgi:hypothetical protein
LEVVNAPTVIPNCDLALSAGRLHFLYRDVDCRRACAPSILEQLYPDPVIVVSEKPICLLEHCDIHFRGNRLTF